MKEQLEQKIVELIAWDRLDKPISSLSGKMKRKKPKLASEIDFPGKKNYFNNERVYARYEEVDNQKARGMREGVELFKERYPKQGEILEGLIKEKRVKREKHVYFGTVDDSRLTSEDYMNVMKDLGFTEYAAYNIYPELMKVSRKLQRARKDSERSVLIG